MLNLGENNEQKINWISNNLHYLIVINFSCTADEDKSYTINLSDIILTIMLMVMLILRNVISILLMVNLMEFIGQYLLKMENPLRI